jgi:hypothetical protein
MSDVCFCGHFLRPVLHKFANEDVSLGAWLLGLEVEHVDDRSMCCATPPGRSSTEQSFFSL